MKQEEKHGAGEKEGKKEGKKMEGKGRVGKKDTGVEEHCKKVGQPQIARRGRREGRIESSS